MKRFIVLFIAFIMLASAAVCVTASAGDRPPLLVDEDELLTEEEFASVKAKLDEVSDRRNTDIAVVTVASLDGKSAIEYADDYFDNNGYGRGETRDGILFLICTEEGLWWMTTSGAGIDYFDDAELDKLEEIVQPYLSDGDFCGAFTAYAEECDRRIENYTPPEPVRMLVDEAGLLSGEDFASLEAKLNEISDRCKTDIAVVIADSFGGKKAYEYAEDYFHDKGYGRGDTKDGILFLIGRNETKWWMSAFGLGKNYFNGAELDTLESIVQPYINDGDYYGAFTAYAEECDRRIGEYTAAGRPPLLVDGADLLSAEDFAALESKLNEISDRRSLDIVVLTVDSLGGKSAMEYADDYFDYNGYGRNETKDGILFLVCMGQRKWWMSTTGMGITYYDDAELEHLEDLTLSKLSSGRYYEAFTAYAEECDVRIDEYIESLKPKYFLYAVIGVIVGLIVAFVNGNKYKRELVSVTAKGDADDYIAPEGLELTVKEDVFAYSSVSKVYIEPSSSRSGGGSSTHTSSSGSSHGGRGGSF